MMLRSLLLAFVLILPFAAQAAAPGDKPNIIFLLSDDHRADVLGCAGHPIVKTPHLDKLASKGVRFTNAFVTTSICAASRATIFTGLVERTHNYTFGKPPIATRFIDDSYPVKLREAGYRTGFFGKFGVSLEGGRAAMNRMFDESQSMNRAPYMKKQKDGSLRHTDDIAVDRALKFIADTPEGKPFCVSVSFNGGHAEDGDKVNHYTAAPPERGLYADTKMPLPKLHDKKIFEALPEFMRKSMNRDRYFWRWDTPAKYQKNMREYLQLLSTVDRNVGRIVAELQKRGLADNTVVIFMGDNGYYMGERGFAGKWSHYEQSLRVPLIVYDPAADPAMVGKVHKTFALNTDIAPTILAAAGIAQPQRFEGRSLTDVTRGHKIAHRDGFYCEHRMEPANIPQWEGFRGERYVYARYYEQKPAFEFLHDLQNDPDQLTNLATDPAHKATLEKMRARTAQLSARYAKAGQPNDGGKPRVLLLGDSISMGYHRTVVEAMKDEAFVTRPKENCAGTTKGVVTIDKWLQLQGGDFDVIHFNFGLHDLKAVTQPGGNTTTNNPDDPRQADLQTYEKQLRAIVKKLKATDATLIFATTTPFPAGVKPHRLPEDAVKYNAVARKIMKENGIAINDLYSFALPKLKEIQRPANVHFHNKGSAVLGNEVARHLRAAIKAPAKK